MGTIEKSVKAVNGFSDFDVDEKDLEAVGKMLPYQNLFYLRQGLEALGD